MKLELAVGSTTQSAELDLPAGHVRWAASKNPSQTRSWEEIVTEALDRPIGTPRLRDHDLRGKKIAVITDDWGRPTPAHRVLPAVLHEVELAGARREDVTVMTASGVHE